MKQLDSFEKGYISASIDAEGSIMIFSHNRLNMKRNIYYDACIAVSNIDKNYLLKLKEMCGGRIDGPYNQKNIFQSCYYRWSLGNKNEIYELVKQVVSYLIIKRKQARLVMKFIRLPKAKNQFDSMNDWIHTKQKKMAIYMKLLNRKSKHAFIEKPVNSEETCNGNSEPSWEEAFSETHTKRVERL